MIGKKGGCGHHGIPLSYNRGKRKKKKNLRQAGKRPRRGPKEGKGVIGEKRTLLRAQALAVSSWTKKGIKKKREVPIFQRRGGKRGSPPGVFTK